MKRFAPASMIKRLIAFVAAVVLGALAHADGTATWTDWNGVTWKFTYDDSEYTAEITGASGYSDTLEIPRTVAIIPDKYFVTSIGTGAFNVLNDSSAKGLKSVTIPATVRWIGDGAFWGGEFTYLTINSESSQESSLIIGTSAFYGCTRLGAVVIPDCTILIDDKAFINCTSLKDVTFAGYTFKGWYTAADGGMQVYDASGKCVIGSACWDWSGKWKYAGNLTVYAQWTQNSTKYTLMCNPIGGKRPVTLVGINFNPKKRNIDMPIIEPMSMA